MEKEDEGRGCGWFGEPESRPVCAGRKADKGSASQVVQWTGAQASHHHHRPHAWDSVVTSTSTPMLAAQVTVSRIL